jgi:hypothetical protein
LNRPLNNGTHERGHIPALTPAGLELARLQLAGLPITEAAKRQLLAMMAAASDPDAERIDNVVAGLPDERRTEVEQATTEIARTFRDIGARGATALAAMSDDVWDELVKGD